MKRPAWLRAEPRHKSYYCEACQERHAASFRCDRTVRTCLVLGCTKVAAPGRDRCQYHAAGFGRY
jgi:hypothetical protein